MDGLALSYLQCSQPEMLALMVELHGGEGTPADGTQGYARGVSWGDGSYVLWGGESQRETCHLKLPGEMIEHRPWDEQVQLLRRLMLGATCKMVHLALDIEADRPLELLERVNAWVRAGYVRNYRRISPMQELNVVDGECHPLGQGIYMGSKTSDRRVVIYDKGAELGISYDGRHVRIEYRVRKDVAHFLALDILRTPTPVNAAHLVLGSIRWADEEGREPVEWLELVELVGGRKPVEVRRGATSLEGFVMWARRALGGRLGEMAYLSGVPVQDLAAELFAGIEAKKPARIDRCLQEYQAGHGFSVGDTIE